MKKLNLLMLGFLVATLSSCSVIGGIFKAGAYTAIIGIVIVIAIIIWIISAFRGKS
ncbi:phosphatidate cytidylyltransferase [Mucilaginibacter glaciei]|uniref:Phosphatidate cytidylyltransferase n=1 Tax=Mucilaginibacter glaciei TaxID=2772109 RepID=A0A926NM45_9SPHI|nr:phosphatidate cytidylyltransferase [Mucilaginibacter glaciei]MBD1391743.1 phosphatidate cytidylyltransferase [Mucilaginibacter glaciei]